MRAFASMWSYVRSWDLLADVGRFGKYGSQEGHEALRFQWPARVSEQLSASMQAFVDSGMFFLKPGDHRKWICEATAVAPSVCLSACLTVRVSVLSVSLSYSSPGV